MNTTLSPNHSPTAGSSSRASVDAHSVSAARGFDADAPVRREPIDELSVHFAGPSEREALSELALRAGLPRPAGPLMVGALGDRVLAAVSVSNREALSEPTASGDAAAAVVAYTVARLQRRPRAPRRAGTAS
jgi:hypothetical protein